MKEKEKDLGRIIFRKDNQLDLPEFYSALNNAIKTNNTQSVYELSKIFTRYYFKELDA
ncbi:MAG: hypothetical protein ACFFDF_16685 [Candidatus Odinarchaeota archaeon]